MAPAKGISPEYRAADIADPMNAHPWLYFLCRMTFDIENFYGCV